MKNKRNKNIESKKGFTLLELLVVVLIIGILAGIALPQYRRAVGKAELTQLISATKVIQNAAERYYLINGRYTTNLVNLDIVLPNNKVRCVVEKKWSYCYNTNHVLIHYYAEQESSSSSNVIECYAKNKALVSACEAYLNKKAELSYNWWCSPINAGTPCWAVWGVKMPM